MWKLCILAVNCGALDFLLSMFILFLVSQLLHPSNSLPLPLLIHNMAMITVSKIRTTVIPNKVPTNTGTGTAV